MDEGTSLESDKGTAIRLMKTLGYFRLVKDTRVLSLGLVEGQAYRLKQVESEEKVGKGVK